MAEEDPSAQAELERLMETAAFVDVDPAFAWIWRAWWRLHWDRGMAGIGIAGVHLQRIPWTTLVTWCEWHGLGMSDLDLFDACVLELDKIYIDWCRTKMRGAV